MFERMSRRFLLALALSCLMGCSRSVRSNANCGWLQEAKTPLDLNTPQRGRHLSEDAELAEDLAIRYADVCCRPSGTRHSMAEYVQSRDRCMAKLFEVVAKDHSVTQEQVRKSINADRHASLDAVVILLFSVLYGLAASWMAEGVWRHFPPRDGWFVGVAAVLVISSLISLTGVLVGEMWSTLAEEFRVGTDHLSYRVDRIPWIHHRLGIFVVGVIIFLLLSAFHYRTARIAPKNNFLSIV
jgi:uncharacterized membrane-anchored protein YhcB (DUF1043 family)